MIAWHCVLEWQDIADEARAYERIEKQCKLEELDLFELKGLDGKDE